MRLRAPAAVLGLFVVIAAASACSNPLGKQYEYEEQVYLTMDGGASIIIDASIPALVALRGAALNPASTARVDQAAVQKVFEQSGCQNIRQVGSPWRRKDRWFIQVRIDTDDVRQAGRCGMLNWSTYAFERDAGGLHYEQRVGAAAGGNPGKVNWDGSELVAFRLHLPSRIVYHNLRKRDTDEAGSPDRGNILTFEQPLAERRAGLPLHMDVRMEGESILRHTLILFAGATAAALATMATLIWLAIRRGRARARAART